MRDHIAILIRTENSNKENILYQKAVEKYGGKVLLINDNEEFNNIDEKLSSAKGILLTGGTDVGRLDFYLIEYALKNGINLFGICQGMQSMALYGTSNKLEMIGNDSHNVNIPYCHNVIIYPGRLKAIVKNDKINVNSYHIQTVSSSKIFDIVARSDDNLIEAVENSNHKFQIGVQWHPERMIEYDENSRRLFDCFVNL